MANRSPRDRIRSRAHHWLRVVSLGTAACGSSPPVTTLEPRGYEVSDPVTPPPPEEERVVDCRLESVPVYASFARVGDGYELVLTISTQRRGIEIVSATVSPEAEVRIERIPDVAILRLKPQRIESSARIRVVSTCQGNASQLDYVVSWTDPQVIASSELLVEPRRVSP